MKNPLIHVEVVVNHIQWPSRTIYLRVYSTLLKSFLVVCDRTYISQHEKNEYSHYCNHCAYVRAYMKEARK